MGYKKMKVEKMRGVVEKMIGLIDVDSKIPNLALMKISSYYKSLGEQVEFVQKDKQYEKIYASSIFTRSKFKRRKI